MEARFLKERRSVTADIYKRNTSNLVYLINLPQSSGYSNVLSNIGEMENKGVEISLATDIIRKKDFRWNLNANWSTNKNKLVKSRVSDATFDSGESESANQEGMNFN